ncbi:MAG: RNA methyltransferase [Eubacterium sp.]|nr:RNA methyltransferase [Eubacterium sp.]
MSVITSRDSKTFKELQRLTQKKYRDREGLFIAEGPNVVDEALGQESIEVVRVFAREGSGFEDHTEDTVILSDKLFDSIADTVTSQGVIAVIRKPDRGSAAGVLKSMAEAGRNVIVLDRLQDPGNIGTIIRTAEGAGIGAAIFIKGTCDPFSPKVVRACAGSILRLPVVFADSAEDLIGSAHDNCYSLAVTDVRNGVPYYSAGLSGDRKALVIGNEGNGVSDTFLDEADILVNIPMQGRLESLNASVAAALLMYEMARPE